MYLLGFEENGRVTFGADKSYFSDYQKITNKYYSVGLKCLRINPGQFLKSNRPNDKFFTILDSFLKRNLRSASYSLSLDDWFSKNFDGVLAAHFPLYREWLWTRDGDFIFTNPYLGNPLTYIIPWYFTLGLVINSISYDFNDFNFVLYDDNYDPVPRLLSLEYGVIFKDRDWRLYSMLRLLNDNIKLEGNESVSSKRVPFKKELRTFCLPCHCTDKVRKIINAETFGDIPDKLNDNYPLLIGLDPNIDHWIESCINAHTDFSYEGYQGKSGSFWKN